MLKTRAGTTIALAAGALAMFTAATADADEPRFRAGGGIEIGPVHGFGKGFSPGGALFGQLGIQINDLVGVYALPNLEVFGPHDTGGVGFGTALMGDLTFADRVSIGVGPETQAYLAGEGGGTSLGARAHLALYPLGYRPRGAPFIRHALAIGVDFSILHDVDRNHDVGLYYATLFSLGYQRF